MTVRAGEAFAAVRASKMAAGELNPGQHVVRHRGGTLDRAVRTPGDGAIIARMKPGQRLIAVQHRPDLVA